MFKLPSCPMTAPCFARSHGYCRILRDFDPRWESRGCPFRKPTNVGGDEDIIMRMYREGAGLPKIGLAVGYSDKSVELIIKRLIATGKLEPREMRFRDPKKISKAKALLALGTDPAAIAEQVGVHRSTVCRWQKEGLI